MIHLSSATPRVAAAFIAATFGFLAATANAQVVVSQVYGGAGTAGAAYQNDYVELFNRGAASAPLAGLTVQYASATGTGNFTVGATLAGSIPAGGYFLVQMVSGTGTLPLPTPDVIGTSNMSGTNGKIVLVNSASALACNGGSTPCSGAQLALIVDLVGYGTANFFEGAGAAPVLTITTAAFRAAGGCTDTNNNAADFAAASAAPRNSGTTVAPCGASTNPSGTGAASPSSVIVGNTTLLTVATTPGANPTSTGITVTTDLSTIGGGATQAFFDDGTNGDVTGGDGTFSFLATVALATTPGAKSLPFTVADAQARSGTGNINLTILGPTNPSVTGTSTPTPVGAGGSVTLTATVTPGDNPTSSGMTVSGDLTLIGGAASVAFRNDGAGCDPTAGDNSFCLVAAVSVGTSAGVKLLPLTVNDAQARSGTGDVSVTVTTDPTPPTGIGASTPGSVGQGRTVLLTVAVSPGTSPVSTGITVVTDLSSVGLSANQSFADDGNNGDVIGGDGVYSYLAAIPGSATAGPKSLTATIADAQARSSIAAISTFVFTPVAAIQGASDRSPFCPLPAPCPSVVVTSEGIVTGRANNGFYFQSAANDADADPGTSEGLFVFTSSVPAAAIDSGARVRVTGTVAEFVPSTDPAQQPLTQLSNTPTVTVLSAGNALPTPVTLTTTFPLPGGPITQLERLENMRVTAPSMTAVSPVSGNVNEANATGSTNGRFYVVVTGVQRPLREPGLQSEDFIAGGFAAPIPEFDGNSEHIQIETARARNAANVARTGINLDVGATLANVVGIIDYSFRTYRLMLDLPPDPVVVGGMAPTAVAAANANEISVGTYNVQRFFNDVSGDNVPGNTVTLTPTAFQNRLNKASLGIRNFMRTPDVIGLVEIENLVTVQALANKINADAVIAIQPNPQYQAFLVNGNDIGGINVGFLVKTAPVAGVTPRVSNPVVTQIGAATLLACPDGTPIAGSLLNDRPPLLLQGSVNAPNTGSFPLAVFVVHNRSLGSVNSTTATTGANACFLTEGNRVRQKRQQQAAFLAGVLQGRQVANPTERVVVVGDFNAFEFNDGWGDSLGTIIGVPTPDNQTVVGGDGVDLVQPDYINLTLLSPPAERYSFSFDGNGQSLDHILVNAGLTGSTQAMRLEHARLNADFGEDSRSDPNIPVRLADHDPSVAIFAPDTFRTADLTLTGSATPSAIAAGNPVDLTLNLGNAGPDAAIVPNLLYPLPTGTTFVSLTSPAGWACTTPAVGTGGSMLCTRASLASGAPLSTFVVRVFVPTNVSGTIGSTATAAARSTDVTPASATISIAVTPGGDPIFANGFEP